MGCGVGTRQRKRQARPGLRTELQLNSNSANLIAETPREPFYLLKSGLAEDPHLSNTGTGVPSKPSKGWRTKPGERPTPHTCCLTPVCHLTSYLYEVLSCRRQPGLRQEQQSPGKHCFSTTLRKCACVVSFPSHHLLHLRAIPHACQAGLSLGDLSRSPVKGSGTLGVLLGLPPVLFLCSRSATPKIVAISHQ